MSNSVLFDISPVSDDPKSHTGLARYAISLADALIARTDVNLEAMAWGSLFAAVQVKNYLKQHGEFPSANWDLPAFQKYLGHQLSSRGRSAPFLRPFAQLVNATRDPFRGMDLQKYNLIHSTYARLHPALARHGVKRLLTIHDLTPLLLPQGVAIPHEQAALRRILRSIQPEDYIVCVSESTRNDFLEFTGHACHRTSMIHNGVDHSRFNPEQDEASISATLDHFGIGDASYLMTLSSLAPHKNIITLFKAWHQINSRTSTGCLVVAGSQGNAREELLGAAGLDSNSASRIVFTGYISDEQYRQLASRCNGFLFPSLYEGFGLPALEAMACGAPVAASNTSSLPEIVSGTGYLLPPESVDAWADIMLKLISDSRRTAPHKPSLQRASEFSWTSTASQYAKLYSQITFESS